MAEPETGNQQSDTAADLGTDELIRQFKSEYEEKGNGDLLYQIPYLSKLADIYQQKGDWASLLRAHSMYNSCAVRDPEKKDQWMEKAYQVQVSYWQTSLHSFSQHLHATKALKYELEEIRDKWRKWTDRISESFKTLNCDPDKLSCPENQEIYSQILQDIPVLSQSLNQAMVMFSCSVVERSLLICGSAPCGLCVVGLGSMAKGEATPYSDMEFLFLVESSSDDVMQYFQRLAVTIYFLIGNLGETKLKVMAIPELMTWDEGKQKYVAHWFDDVGMSGFKIDGLGSWAGNIPTGGTPGQCNQFICTVKKLIERYKSMLDDPDPVKSLIGDLTAMLANTVFIYGDEKLHMNLRSLIASQQPSDDRKSVTRKMMAKDASKFDFRLDADLTVTRHVKTDVYRYPSLLVQNLKILHNIYDCDPWCVIDILEEKGFISGSIAESLRFSLSCALFIRLSAYLYHNSQNDCISVLSCNAGENLYKGAWYVRPELLSHMFIHLSYLKAAVKKVVENPDQTLDFEQSARLTHISAAMVRYFCGDYEQSLSLFQAAYPNGGIPADMNVRNMYIHSAINCSEYTLTETLLTSNSTSEECDNDDYHAYLMGRFYQDQCFFHKALDSYKKRLALLLRSDSKRNIDSEEVVQALCNIAAVLQSQSEYAKALVEYRRSLEICQKIFDGKDHRKIAEIRGNIGTLLTDLGKIAEAQQEYEASLDMMVRIHGDRDHNAIADLHQNLGMLLKEQNRFPESLAAYKKCLEMKLRIHGGKNNANIANVLCNIGIVLDMQGKDDESLAAYSKCLTIRRQLYGISDHEDIASVLSNIGAVYKNQGEYGKAMSSFTECLDIFKRIFGDGNHEAIANVLCNIGLIHSEQGEQDKALDCYRECLDIFHKIYEGGDHSKIVTILSNTGVARSRQGNLSEALEEYHKSLEMSQRLYGSADNVGIADVLFNIGVALCNQGQIEEALVELRKSQSMFLRLFRDESHPCVRTATDVIEQIEKYVLE